LAHANLELTDLSLELDTPARVEAARASARKAIALDDANAEAHLALGRIHLDRDWDFQKAVGELRRAVVLDPVSIMPTLYYSRALTIVGDLAGAEEAVSVARMRLPAIPDLLFEEGSVYFLAHKFEKMEAIGRELIALTPNRALGYWLVGISLEQRSRITEAIATFESGLREAPKDDHRTLCALGHSYALAGEQDRAMATMRRYLYPDSKTITRYTLAYCAALTYTALKQKDKAFEWLDRAREAKDNSFPFFPRDPRFDGLREDPRYSRLAGLLK
jgi:serine/threonine-protein kinase